MKRTTMDPMMATMNASTRTNVSAVTNGSTRKKVSKTTLTLAALAAAALSGCANLAPVYERPSAPVPSSFPGQANSADEREKRASDAASATPDVSVTDWHDVVLDDRLRGVIELAVANNRNLRSAVLAIEQARAIYGIEEAGQWPTLRASATASTVRTPAQASSTGRSTLLRTFSVGLGVSAYEIDLFGRVRNLKEGALESFLSTEQATRSTQVALIGEVANAWLTLAADRSLLALARETLGSQRRTFEMTQRRLALGADSGLTLAQTQTGVENARRDVAAFEAQVQLDVNALTLLTGVEPPARLLPDVLEATDGAALVAVPAGLPSSMLQRRPDVLAAEHALKAANADIGAARASFYPSISLTSSAGTASRSLADLFKGGTWSFVPTISLPIFDGGASRATLRLAEVASDIRLASYDSTIQIAFREVADALTVRDSLAERLDAQTALVAATQRTLDLAQARWQRGATSFLEVLDAQRSLYAAQQTLITLRLTEQANRLTLFKALGGGSQNANADGPVGRS